MLLGPTGSGQPALAFWVAAMREAFEETGILLCRGEKGADDPLLQGNPEGREEIMARARYRLLAGDMTFHQVLVELNATLDASALAYVGHWLTPECEPRRYETRFFLAEAPSDVRVTPHEKELVEALWITPGDALARNREGTLPLVLPTLFTLEQLEPFRSPREAMRQLKARPIPRRLPRPERTQGGVRFHLED
jgi:8-oxo-dGTP pyrophosphatase MutT (NUDIX family)